MSKSSTGMLEWSCSSHSSTVELVHWFYFIPFKSLRKDKLIIFKRSKNDIKEEANFLRQTCMLIPNSMLTHITHLQYYISLNITHIHISLLVGQMLCFSCWDSSRVGIRTHFSVFVRSCPDFEEKNCPSPNRIIILSEYCPKEVIILSEFCPNKMILPKYLLSK